MATTAAPKPAPLHPPRGPRPEELAATSGPPSFPLPAAASALPALGMSAAGLERPQVVAHVQQSLNYTVFDCKWVPRSARLLCLGSAPRGTGVLQLYELRGGRLLLLSEIEKAKPIKCATFGAASLQQRHLILHLPGGFPLFLFVILFHFFLYIEAVWRDQAAFPWGNQSSASIWLTALHSSIGTVKVWDPRQKETPVANMEPAQGESKRDCWTVAFGNAYNQEERVVCAGYDNGDIKLFDLKTMSLRWETNIKNGVCSVEFDRKDVNMNKLVATSLEGKFHVFDMRTQHPTKGFASVSEKAHKSTIWQVRHLPQNRDVFMTSGGAGSLHLWK
ncbi:WD repeat-containing protein 92 [Phasianus colchicus]|uniref:WD repeat-containing protein 92 n=1 Tax=Phasianus colchicus TaxID=9054 RepID=UPI00129E578E|nr:WD repeat-containing protein 92 [Phasianus colchicus]